LSSEGGNALYACDLPDELIWTRDRQKQYLSIPPIQVTTYDLATGLPRDTDVKNLPTAKTCTSITYDLPLNERLDSVSSAAQETRSPSPGTHTWDNCEAIRRLTVYDDNGKLTRWAVTTPLAVRGFIAIDEAKESQNEQNTFLAGIALGLVGALVVEALSLIVLLLQSLGSRRRKNQRRDSESKRPAADVPASDAQVYRTTPYTASLEPLHPYSVGVLWESYLEGTLDKSSTQGDVSRMRVRRKDV
jgi:hypothetical protein